MKSFFSLLFLSSLLFISCKKELKPQDNSSSSKIVPFTEAANIQQNQPVLPSLNENTITQSTTNASPVAVAKGMNPAHGQPGHRCDIPVGTPLNAPALSQNNAAPAVQQQANTVTTPIASTTTSPTLEGMNPPHGQENHRCDIAVGAPLPKE